MNLRIVLRHATARCLIAFCIPTAAMAAGDGPAPSVQDETAIAHGASRLQDAFVRSGDLRVRIIYSTEAVWTDENELNKGVSVREVVPAAQLVEQARGSTDPLVLDLMVQRCGYQAGCDAAGFARRWTEADTQNQLAWLTLASVLRNRGDAEEARATFLRAAQASSWHEHYSDYARVLMAASPGVVSPRMRTAILMNALGQAGKAGIPFGPFRVLGDYCKEDGEARVACARIVATMARDADTLLSLSLAAPYARRAHVDPLIVAGYRQESEALRWATRFIVARDSENLDLDLDHADDETLRHKNARLQAVIDVGERRSGDEALLKQHIGKSQAASRLVATMSPEQLVHRAQITGSN